MEAPVYKIGSTFRYNGKYCRITFITKKLVHFVVLGLGVESHIDTKIFPKVVTKVRS